MPSSSSRRILVGFRLVEALRDVLPGIGKYVKQHQRDWQIHCVDAGEFVRNLRPSSADGVITVITPVSRDRLAKVRRIGVPVVNMFHDGHPMVPSVLSDDPQFGTIASRHMVERGFRFALSPNPPPRPLTPPDHRGLA